MYENNHGSSEVMHFNFISSWIDKASWLGLFASGESAESLFLGFLDYKVSMSISSVLNSIVVCLLSVI
jgi:hypothetical protein